MVITRRLNRFIKETAVKASSGESPFTYDECVKEYTEQIITDDYSWMVIYAMTEGIKIPRILKISED